MSNPESKKEKKAKDGKSWTTHSKFASFEEAHAMRQDLEDAGYKRPEHKSPLQVKVRSYVTGTFKVLTRERSEV